VKIAICYNSEKSEAQTVARSLQSVLTGLGIDFYSVREVIEPATDVLCVVGGDGTLFTYAHFALEYDLPIWFINAGSVGFLAESHEGLSARAARLNSGDYSLDARPLLAVSCGDRAYLALNDVCLMRDTRHLQTITLSVAMGGEQVARYRGDGALVCTAMGSTGYALSAGAPIMAPNAEGMLFTPICAHSLAVKPVLFGRDSTVRLCALEPAVLFVDGVSKGVVDGLDVVVRGSDRAVRFVRTEAQSFFAKIGSKLL